MKTKLSHIIAAMLFTGVATSCSDFLDRYPLDELSDNSFWKTEGDAMAAVTDIYGCLPTWDQDEDINSDNAVMGIKWAAGNISKGVYTPEDQDWSGSYSSIRQCNNVLIKSKDIAMSEESRKKIEGQAYFFRAFVYFNLIRSYGDVPYIEQPLNLSDVSDITRTSRDVVYEKVMADFDKAIEYLPTEWDAANTPRITKGAALAMKARAALYYGNWETAAQASKAVIDLGQYKLYDAENTGKYKELFWEKTENCSENILRVQFHAPEKEHYLIGWECFPTKGWGGMNPTQSLVDAFEDNQGAPIATSKIYNPTDPFKNRDPRLEVNILHDGEEMYGVTIKIKPLKSSGNTGISQHNDATATGYYGQKWLDPSIDSVTDGWHMGKDWVVLRYAEVLLTYAEAMNELHPACDEAFNAVNQVRKRVGMPELQKSDASKPTYCADQAALRKRIQNEWRVEFALEGGKRMWDIRRWGIAKEVLNAPFLGIKMKPVEKNGQIVDYILYQGDNIKLAGSHYEDHNYLFPIPQKEMELNDKLTQNPGY